MLKRVDRDTIAAILGPDWDQPQTPEPSTAQDDEKTERNIDTPSAKPEQ
jgi:hypothetical protein